jgi:3-oxoacyl-[acyl-carrier-protein] synthase-1
LSDARVIITGASVLSPLGCSLEEVRARIAARERGLSLSHRFPLVTKTPLGEIPWHRIGVEEPAALASDELLMRGARSILEREVPYLERYGADRIGLFVGTTTCGVSGFAAMNRQRRTTGEPIQQLLNPDMQQAFIAHGLAGEFAIAGPVYTVSTSCVASSQALALAFDALRTGWVDAALVLGMDILNPTTIHGFEALQLLDPDFTKPFTKERAGLNLSEALVGLRLERNTQEGLAAIRSYDALSEAHHMTQPATGGQWMAACMSRALKKAALSPDAIAYINPHATGTEANDQAEMAAISEVFGSLTQADPTKSLSGHSLGASGALEVLFCALEMQRRGLPFALKNSFGFGGANLSLVLEQVRP